MEKDDLKKFCSEESLRESFLTPWSKDKYSMATNGMLVIRIPRLEDIPENPNAPDLFGIFPKNQPEEWFEIPPLPEEEYESCEECLGSGKARYGKGKSPETCEGCDGKGKFLVKNQKIEIGSAVFAAWVLRMIADLPDVKIGPMKPGDPAWIKFNGGDGVIMQIRSQRRD